MILSETGLPLRYLHPYAPSLLCSTQTRRTTGRSTLWEGVVDGPLEDTHEVLSRAYNGRYQTYKYRDGFKYTTVGVRVPLL